MRGRILACVRACVRASMTFTCMYNYMEASGCESAPGINIGCNDHLQGSARGSQNKCRKRYPVQELVGKI